MHCSVAVGINVCLCFRGFVTAITDLILGWSVSVFL